MSAELAPPSQDAASLKRREFAREVLGLFYTAEREGQARALSQKFGEIFLTMLDDLELDERVQLSETMASSPDASHPLMRQMSMDDVAVAGPILERSPLLTEDDLIAVSQNATTEHRLAVSRRETGLTARVTDSLISFGEAPVLRSVTGNQSAEISEDGFKTLAAASVGGDDELLARLAARIDIPPDCAATILPKLSDELRAKLMALATSKGSDLEELVAKAKSTEAGQKLSARQQKIEAKALIEDIEKGLRKLDDVALMLAEARRPHALIAVLAARSMLPVPKVTDAIFEVKGDLIRFLCRALQLSFSTYAACDALRRESLHLPSGKQADLEAAYEALAVDEARRTLRLVSVMMNVG